MKNLFDIRGRVVVVTGGAGILGRSICVYLAGQGACVAVLDRDEKAGVKNVIPRHLECISAKLRETGTIVQENEDSVLVKGASTLRRVNVKTLPYPGFPTDMQPPMGTLLCLANGTSVITEGVYDNRFKYMNELRKMGAEVQVDGRVAVIEGGRRLTGALVQACDLRAGAAMVIAGMCAVGTTIVEDIHYIERGYEDFVGKLNALGADIKIVDFPDNDDSEKIISVV